MTLHLVRETKGTEDMRALQLPHEQRKIECAEKYFTAAGVDYRPITGETVEWWKPWGEAYVQQDLPLPDRRRGLPAR